MLKKVYNTLLFFLVFPFSYALYTIYLNNFNNKFTIYSIKDFYNLQFIKYNLIPYMFLDYTYYITLIIAFVVYIFLAADTTTLPKKVKEKVDNNVEIETKGLTKQQIKKAQELPKVFNFATSVKNKRLDIINATTKEQTIEEYDYLAEITPTSLIYKNRTGKINYKNYANEKENIKQYLNLDFIEILRYKDNAVKINYVDTLNLKNFVLQPNMLKKDYVYLGVNREQQQLYIPIHNIQHALISGQTGAGKSVFQNVLLASIFYNMQQNPDLFEHIYLIDLKGGVEFTPYTYINKQKITVVDNIKDLYSLIDNITKIMHTRLKKMKELGIKNIRNNYIYIVFDEYAQIADNRPQNDPEALKKWNKLQDQLRSLAALARAAGIRLFITTQKASSDAVDTTLRDNLPLRFVLKQQSIQGAQMMLGGSTEILDELGVDPREFSCGRFIFVDPTATFSKGIKYHVAQSPFISEDFYLNFVQDPQLREYLFIRDILTKELENFYKDNNYKVSNKLLQEANVTTKQEIEEMLENVVKKIQQYNREEIKQEQPKQHKEDKKIKDVTTTFLEDVELPKQNAVEEEIDELEEEFLKLLDKRKQMYKQITKLKGNKRLEAKELYSTIKTKMDSVKKIDNNILNVIKKDLDKLYTIINN